MDNCNNYDDTSNISCINDTCEIKYEITDSISHSTDINDDSKNKIINILNDENFFNHDEHDSEFSELNDITLHDKLLAQQLDYFENYNIKMLHHIASYYNISKGRLKKGDLICLITQFENKPENYRIVCNRKRYWHYINELKNDSYFGKFILF